MGFGFGIGGPGSGGNVGGRRASVRSNYRTRAREGGCGFSRIIAHSRRSISTKYSYIAKITMRLTWEPKISMKFNHVQRVH